MDRRYKKRIERYWKSMEFNSEETLSKLDLDGWFDLWHIHIDWDGKGNRPVNLLRATELTYETLKKVESLFAYRKNDVQCFALFKNDTALNSIYVHTENPNGGEYPFAFEGVDWGKESELLSKVINKRTHEIGQSDIGEESSFFVRTRF